MASDVYISVDLGASRVRAGRFSTDLEMLARTEAPSLADKGRDIVLANIFEQVDKVWPTDGSKVIGIGVCAPGPLNPETGMVVNLTNFVGWRDVPLRELFVKKYGIETFLGNDGNVAALAEAALGAGKGHSDVVFLTISTGVGGGVISAGKMLVGADGMGAECGHMIMLTEAEHVSTLEKETAGPGLARQARQAIQAGEKSSILELAGGALDAINAKHVSQAAKNGDALGLRIMTRAGKILGLGILSLLHIFNPQIVVLGGAVMEGSWDLMYGPMMEAIKEFALQPDYWNHLQIVPAALGENVSLIGSAVLALRKGAQ